MIPKNQYLKSLKRMNENEKLEYLAQVDKWTSETYPYLASLDDGWKETDMKDFDEGLKLATALQKAIPFVEQAHRYDIKRRLEKLNKILSEVRIKSGMAALRTRPASDVRRFTAVIPPEPKRDEEGKVIPRAPFKMPEVDGRTPEHLSQYLHLLPADLQKEAKNIDAKYAQLAHWRGRAEYAVNDPRANKALISNMAKKVVKIEGSILNFWHRVDLEYARATGKAVDEDIAAELKAESEKLNKPEVKSPGEYTLDEIELMEDEEIKQTCRNARIEANKKYLRRDDVQMTDERKAEMALRISELIQWGKTPSAKVEDICNRYNIIVPGFNDTPKPSLFDKVEEPSETEAPSDPSDSLTSSDPSESSENSESSEPSESPDSPKPSKKKKATDPYDL